MTNNVLSNQEQAAHPKDKGVFLRHFFCSKDNDRLNNLEVTIVPGAQISQHIHDSSSEFYYVVRGAGEIFLGEAWYPIRAGDAMKAGQGVVHALRCVGNESLVLFSTFSPAIR
jgi:mannose-6-phosphate isomerase-like protein (cupin superfamily)